MSAQTAAEQRTLPKVAEGGYNRTHAQQQTPALFDHLIGGRQECGGEFKPEQCCSFSIEQSSSKMCGRAAFGFVGFGGGGGRTRLSSSVRMTANEFLTAPPTFVALARAQTAARSTLSTASSHFQAEIAPMRMSDQDVGDGHHHGPS